MEPEQTSRIGLLKTPGIYVKLVDKLYRVLVSVSFYAALTFICVNTPVIEAAEDDIVQRLNRIEQLLQNQGLIDMLQQLETLQQQINQLRGEIELQNHTIEQLTKRQRALYTDLDQRIQKLSASPQQTYDVIPADPAGTQSPPLQTLSPVRDRTLESPNLQQASDPLTIKVETTSPQQLPVMKLESHAPIVETSAPDMEISPGVDPVQIRSEYQQAFELLKQSQYEQAIKAFQTFIASTPVNEYSDNAQYWLAEAYYVTHRYEQALVEYEKLVADYPKSRKLTHAMLKIGYTYQELGQFEPAKTQLQNLKQHYPGTTAARLAEERLKSINLTQQQPPAAITD